MTSTPTEQLRPAAEEAVRRGISRERLVRQIAKGEVPGIAIGGRWFVLADQGESITPTAA